MRIPIRLIPQGVIPRDPQMVFRIERVTEAAPVVAATRLAVWPYVDAFNGTGTLVGRYSDSWHTYPEPIGDGLIAGGMLRVQADDDVLYATVDPIAPTADCFVELLVLSDEWDTYPDNHLAIFIRGGSSDGNYYWARVTLPTTADPYVRYTIHKVVASIDTSLASNVISGASIVAGLPFLVRFSVVGTTVALVIAGSADFSATDSDVPGPGRFTIFMQTDSAADSHNHIAILHAESGTAT